MTDTSIRIRLPEQLSIGQDMVINGSRYIVTYRCYNGKSYSYRLVAV